MVQWLGLSALTAVAWVQSLVGELKILQARWQGQKKKKNHFSDPQFAILESKNSKFHFRGVSSTSNVVIITLENV